MSPYVKPYMSVRSQIELLKRRGLDIQDEQHAAYHLSRIGYYRLSAYWHPFRQLPEDLFHHGVKFEEVMAFYHFDGRLRRMVAEGLEHLEIGVRAALCDELGALGPWAHRDERSYDGRWKRSGKLKDWLQRQDEYFDRSKEAFSAHFRARYDGRPPIWVAACAWDWGVLSHCVSGLSHRNRDAICARLHHRLEGRQLISWLRTLNEVRNACAHHSRLWNRVQKSDPAKLSAFSELNIEGRDKRLYSALVVLAILVRSLHPNSDWHIRLARFVSSANLPRQVGEWSAGFPRGWRRAPLWAGGPMPGA